MKVSGYSKTPLAKKLGIKDNYKIRVVNEPSYYLNLFDDLPGSVEFVSDISKKKNLVHYFAKSADVLKGEMIKLKKEILPNGIIWISWPKKSAGVETDITEGVIRDIALKNGLVDVKVCAIDDVWSALKLVIPLKDRK